MKIYSFSIIFIYINIFFSTIDNSISNITSIFIISKKTYIDYDSTNSNLKILSIKNHAWFLKIGIFVE